MSSHLIWTDVDYQGGRETKQETKEETEEHQNRIFLGCSNEMKINLTDTSPFWKIRVLNVRKENVSACFLFFEPRFGYLDTSSWTLDETELDDLITLFSAQDPLGVILLQVPNPLVLKCKVTPK
jgi:hypothetical protein